MIFYLTKIFTFFCCSCLVFSLKEQEQILTQITTCSAYSNELQLIFYIKKDHYCSSSLCNFLHGQMRGITENESPMYVKSFDYFLRNTNSQNIKTPRLYGYSLALSRLMLILSNCSTVTFILSLSQSEKSKQFFWLMKG